MITLDYNHFTFDKTWEDTYRNSIDTDYKGEPAMFINSLYIEPEITFKVTTVIDSGEYTPTTYEDFIHAIDVYLPLTALNEDDNEVQITSEMAKIMTDEITKYLHENFYEHIN